MATRNWTLAAAGAAIVVTTAVTAAQQGARGGEWTRYGGDGGANRYAPLDQITSQNVSQLRVAWQRPAVDPTIRSRVPDLSFSGNFRATPLMIGNVLYSPNGIGLVEAFHPGTGKTQWVQEPFPNEGPQGLRGTSSRGVAYWAHGADRRLFVVRGEYLISLAAATGKPIASLPISGRSSAPTKSRAWRICR
jgi:quinoprotein glucose dehydrogenase